MRWKKEQKYIKERARSERLIVDQLRRTRTNKTLVVTLRKDSSFALHHTVTGFIFGEAC